MRFCSNDRAFEIRLREHFGPSIEECSDDLKWRLYSLWSDGVGVGAGERCESCGTDEGIELERSRTAYAPTEENPEPNQPMHLCRSCAADYHDYWDDMWAEYNSGRL